MFDPVSLLASSGFGTIIGIAGSWLQKREDRKILELSHKHEIEIASLKQKADQSKFDCNIKLADKGIERSKIEGEIKENLDFSQGFVASMKTMDTISGSKVVDGIRSLMRPILSVYLLTIATILTLSVGKLVGGMKSIPETVLLDLYKSVIFEIIFMTSVAVTWWFGSRPSLNMRKR